MFNIYNEDWPKLERALVAFSNEHASPVFLWFTPNGFIAQDAADCCLSVTALGSDERPPEHGLWVWEGAFESLDDIYDSIEGVGAWREPTLLEWKEITNQENPWR
ncbi:MAG: hypothetical protein Q8P20_00470 [bacterium]|nr:hypothetical protein [bacterium]